MNTVKTRAIVIKTQEYKENDKLIWLFTEELGKISVLAKGARKNKNKNFSLTLPFCFGEFVVYKGKSLYTLNEGRIIESFQDILNDYDTLIYGSYFNELIDIACEEEAYISLFRDVVSCFYLLKNKAVDFELLTRAFELKLLRSTGYGLHLENCAVCDRKINNSSFLSFQYFGAVCEECEKAHGTLMSKSTYNVLKFLNSVDVEKVSRLSVNELTKKEIFKIITNFIALNYSRKPKSLSMLDYFKAIPEVSIDKE
ncbi:DNA repair protein RecO [Clostridium sp.]|uniref:DNA repair protein RecO n=1 Tax=Clostridium sp. TaxID=1506 RepID=UPI002FCBD8A0